MRRYAVMCGRELGILFRKDELLGAAFTDGEFAFPCGRNGAGGVVVAVRRSAFLIAILLPALSMARDATTMVRVPSVAAEFDILLEGGEMTRETVVRECAAILDREKDTPFLRIQFADSRATLNSWRSMPDGVLNREFRAFMKRRWNRASVRYAEMVSVRGNAVLRVRDGAGIETIVLRGENPLMLSYEGRNVELVHLGLTYSPSKPAVLFVDIAAVLLSGTLDAELAKHVVQSAQRAFLQPLPTSLTLPEDRFYSAYAPKFAAALLFDLDDPPLNWQWEGIRCAECGVGPSGRGSCTSDRPAGGSRQLIDF